MILSLSRCRSNRPSAPSHHLISRAHACAHTGFQLWLATSLLADAVAVAAQALTARALARRDVPTLKALIRRTTRLGLLVGLLTSAGLALSGGPLCAAFSAEPAVRAACAAAWPLVALTQPLNTLAFAYDGLLFGASDFRFCARLFATSALPASLLIGLAPRVGAGGGGGGGAVAVAGLRVVWAGLGVFMGIRTVLGARRIRSGEGPWAVLRTAREGGDVADEIEKEGEGSREV